jgi:hypothetical protein
VSKSRRCHVSFCSALVRDLGLGRQCRIWWRNFEIRPGIFHVRTLPNFLLRQERMLRGSRAPLKMPGSLHIVARNASGARARGRLKGMRGNATFQHSRHDWTAFFDPGASSVKNWSTHSSVRGAGSDEKAEILLFLAALGTPAAGPIQGRAGSARVCIGVCAGNQNLHNSPEGSPPFSISEPFLDRWVLKWGRKRNCFWV